MKYTRNARELNTRHDRPRVIGITGGIGSGKTVATDALRAAGYTVIDADEISRSTFAVGTDGEKQILSMFPAAASDDGTLDRKKLRSVIATQPDARARLNALTHPMIIAEVERLVAADKTDKPTVLSAPLLLESGLSRLCDATVCIYCPTALRVARIVARDGITEREARDIIAAQIPDTERATLCDYIIPSDRPVNEFIGEIQELLEQLANIK